ncbi:MAG: NUDIX hydrolase [Myxococcota bacterium]
MTRRVLHRGRVGEFGLEDVTLPNGVATTLEVLRHPGAAAVVPLHDDGTVTLIHQHRHCAGGLLWEIPAGKLEPGEDPAACALRELREEAGLDAARVEPLTAILTAPAFTDERIWLYVATGLAEVPPSPDADEMIHPVRKTLAAAIEMIGRGEIVDAKTMCALLLLQVRSSTTR